MVLENNNSNSESSDSDDDHLAQLREAADNDFINDNMFQLAGKKTKEDGIDSKSTSVKISQRSIPDDDGHIDDLLIPEEVQKFVSKKLTKIIESRVEFVDISKNEKTNNQGQPQALQDQIKLLNNVVLKIDWNDSDREPHFKRKRPEIRKRIISDVDNSKSDIIRLKEAVIEIEDISKEVNNWMTKPKRALFEYREKNGRLFEVQPKTEFSEKRQKNNWDESKIARNKKHFT